MGENTFMTIFILDLHSPNSGQSQIPLKIKQNDINYKLTIILKLLFTNTYIWTAGNIYFYNVDLIYNLYLAKRLLYC